MNSMTGAALTSSDNLLFNSSLLALVDVYSGAVAGSLEDGAYALKFLVPDAVFAPFSTTGGSWAGLVTCCAGGSPSFPGFPLFPACFSTAALILDASFPETASTTLPSF